MLEIFDYSFMIRAFIAGIAVGIAAPLIGVFLVARRYALIADSLAHISLAGVAAGIFFGINPLLGALVVALLAAWLLEKLRASGRLSGEVTLAMFLSSGLAVAVVIAGLSQGNVDLSSFLFGSITTVTMFDLWVIVPLSAAIVLLVAGLYKGLLYTSLDDEQAKVSGLPTSLLNQMLVVLAAFTVVVSLRVVGGLLIGALMVIPVAASMQVARSFRQTVIGVTIFGVVAVILGLSGAYYLNLAAGGSIVIVALLLFMGSLGWRKLE